MKSWPKLFLAVQAFLFAAAALVHAGIALRGYEHGHASTAESVIATVLALGLLGCLLRPASMRMIALAVQVFALLGTLVGAFTIWVGIGPQTTADHVFHVALLVVLVAGLAVTGWAGRRRPS